MSDIVLTVGGVNFLRDLVFGGGVVPLVFSHLAVGDGVLPVGAAYEDRVALVHEVMRMPVESVVRGQEGRVIVSGLLSTEALDVGFRQREMGVFVQDGKGGFLLLGYGYYGDDYDFIPAPGGGMAVRKFFSAGFDVGVLRSTFRDIPSDCFVSFDAFNARIGEVVPVLVGEAFAGAREAIELSVEEAGSYAGNAERMAVSAEVYAGQARVDREAVAVDAAAAEGAAGNAAQSESVAREKADVAVASAEGAEKSAASASLSAADVVRIADEVMRMMGEIVPPRLNYDGNHFYFNRFAEPEQPDDMCVYPYAYLKKMVGGKDNYQLWLDAGNVGTLEDFFEAQKGAPGGEQDLSDITQKLESKVEVIWISEVDYGELAEKNPQTLYIIN